MKKTSALLIFLLLCGWTAACNSPSPKTEIEPSAESRSIETILTEMAASTQAAAAVVTPEAVSPAVEAAPAADETKKLNVCLGSEPASLFIYKGISNAGWSILETIYDGPFDIINGEARMVLFDEIISSVGEQPVKEGDLVLNADGKPVQLSAGTAILPTNGVETCGYPGCTLIWQPDQQATLAQSEFTFKLKSGLKWSDGEPLTAADSVYSWRLSGDPLLGNVKTMLQLTDLYEGQDELTVFWRGIPGFVPQRADDVFWLPLPEHKMGTLTTAELAADETVNRMPLGWGAYRITEWIAGNQLKAVRNENYRGNGLNQPYFDEIVFHFFGQAGDNNLAALKEGSCDVIDPSVDLMIDLEPILEDVRDGKLSAYIQPQPVWEQLTFNFAPLTEQQVSYFTDQNLRSGMLQCLDRASIIRQVYYGQSEIPVGFYPAGHVLHQSLLETLPYDPAAGAELLNKAGWIDSDQNAETARVSAGVPGIPDGTQLALTLETGDSLMRTKAAGMIQEQLAACGIDLTVDNKAVGELYQAGPDGSFFGRKFDLVNFAWAAGTQSPCTLYLSTRVPDAENEWIGTNVGGFKSDGYDIACNIARNLSGADQASQLTVQQIYASELPVIPLYYYPAIGVSANNVCGLQNVIGMRSLLWNVESLSKSETSCAASQWHDIYNSGNLN